MEAPPNDDQPAAPPVDVSGERVYMSRPRSFRVRIVPTQIEGRFALRAAAASATAAASVLFARPTIRPTINPTARPATRPPRTFGKETFENVRFRWVLPYGWVFRLP